MNTKIAIIGGSSAYKLLNNRSLGIKKNFHQKLTPFGESSPIYSFSNDSLNFYFLSRHGDKGYSISAPFVNYRANIWALKELGTERIVSWSGPGIINTDFKVGEYVTPHDFLDETKNRHNTFFENKGIGFIRMSEPFCPQIRSFLKQSADKTDIKCHENGVYITTEGPRLETPSEIRKYKAFGADMVGMTLIPEAVLARELEICYAPICYMTNYAEGIEKRVYEEGTLFEGMQTGNEKDLTEMAINNFPNIIKATINLLKEKERTCFCKDAMLRYKKRGDISPNWKSWIK